LTKLSLQQCNDGTYNANLGGTPDCQPCNILCATCNGPTNTDCLTCAAADEYVDAGKCKLCDDSCATCIGGLNTECLTCANTNEWLDAGECKQCHSTCATCNGDASTDCLSCTAPLVLKANQCKTPPTCGSDEFINRANGNCEACHNNCVACFGSGPNQCLGGLSKLLFSWHLSNLSCLVLTSVSTGLGLFVYVFF